MSDETKTCNRCCPVDKVAAGRCLSAVASVGLALVDVRKLSKPKRLLFWLASAGVAAGTAVAWNADESLSDEERLVVAGATAGMTLVSAPLVGRIDMGVTSWLERRGLKHPRRLAAAITAVGIGATVWAERKARTEASAAL